jgi:hypothetical protein
MNIGWKINMPFIKYKPFDRKEVCKSPEHNPPGHIVLKPGIHTWKCPKCGKEITFIVPEVISKSLETGHEYDYFKVDK